MKEYGPTTESKFGVVVKFRQSNGWSNEYTYLSNVSVTPDSLVVVSNNEKFVSVARVKRCIPDYELKPGIKYKHILEVLQHQFADLP
jgi:hypothetical protein